MLKSMTGFGKASAKNERVQVVAEIKSVNSKFMDLNLKFPSVMREREFVVRNLVSEKLERGKVDLLITIEPRVGAQTTGINFELAKRYLDDLRDFAASVNMPDDQLLKICLQMPEVISSGRIDLKEEDWVPLMSAITECINAIDVFRIAEGDAMLLEIKKCVQCILSLIGQVEQLEPERMILQKQKLRNQLEELYGQEGYDKNRFEQELIYYLERLDFSEEKVRLRNHCDFFSETLNSPQSSGRKLIFISQEIGREINTMGSKANHSGIQKIVVAMKDELEKIKEQLMNVI